MRLISFVFLIALAPAACRSASDKATEAPVAQAPAERPSIVITRADGARRVVRVELAITDPEREKGLMFRREMAESDGMLFFFENEAIHSFWMRNTFIPLDMLHVDSAGTIVGIVRDATPRTDTSRQVGKPARFVLEVNGGWSARNGIEPGDKVELGEALATARRSGKWRD